MRRSRTKDQGPRTKDQGSRIKDQGYKGNSELGNKVGGMDKLVCPWMFNFELTTKKQGSRFKDQGLDFP